MASILEFKSSLLGGGARANQFRVELAFPTSLNIAGATAAARVGQFLCTAASLPGSNVGVASTYYRGREVKLAGERVFQNWGIRIINDNDFAIHKAFTAWSKAINDPKNNTGITNPLLYTADMNVHQLDRNGAVVMSYKIADAWPVSISDIDLSFSTNDQIEEFQVELAYSFWETKSTSSSISGTVAINTPFGGIGLGT